MQKIFAERRKMTMPREIILITAAVTVIEARRRAKCGYDAPMSVEARKRYEWI